MTWNPLTLTFIGCRPLVMHSGRLADPLDEFATAIHKVSKKRHKTAADFEELAKLEFLGSLWLAGDPLRPVIPDAAIHACLIEGAKKTRNGPAAKAGLLCDQHAVVEYGGPTDPETLAKLKAFQLRTGVRVNQSRVIRVRPMFPEWRAAVRIAFEDSLLDRDQVISFATRGGFEVGIGDWRPRYGRFRVEAA